MSRHRMNNQPYAGWAVLVLSSPNRSILLPRFLTKLSSPQIDPPSFFLFFSKAIAGSRLLQQLPGLRHIQYQQEFHLCFLLFPQIDQNETP